MNELPADIERRVYRTSIPVDDQTHEMQLTGPIVHVDCRRIDAVEIWHEHSDIVKPETVLLRVFGTGHPVPSGRHLGTALTPEGGLVWHLYQVWKP